MFKEFIKKFIFTKYFVLGVVLVLGYSSTYFLGPDNPIEQEAEKILKDETGKDIDLSPNSDSPNSDSSSEYEKLDTIIEEGTKPAKTFAKCP